MNYLKKKKISNPTRLSKVKKCYWTAAGAAALCLCCVTPAMAAGGDPLDIATQVQAVFVNGTLEYRRTK